MAYAVHRLDLGKNDVQEKLENLLNQLEGEVISIMPISVPSFQGMGATSKVGFLLIVEKKS